MFKSELSSMLKTKKWSKLKLLCDQAIKDGASCELKMTKTSMKGVQTEIRKVFQNAWESNISDRKRNTTNKTCKRSNKNRKHSLNDLDSQQADDDDHNDHNDEKDTEARELHRKEFLLLLDCVSALSEESRNCDLLMQIGFHQDVRGFISGLHDRVLSCTEESVPALSQAAETHQAHRSKLVLFACSCLVKICEVVEAWIEVGSAEVQLCCRSLFCSPLIDLTTNVSFNIGLRRRAAETLSLMMSFFADRGDHATTDPAVACFRRESELLGKTVSEAGDYLLQGNLVESEFQLARVCNWDEELLRKFVRGVGGRDNEETLYQAFKRDVIDRHEHESIVDCIRKFLTLINQGGGRHSRSVLSVTAGRVKFVSLDVALSYSWLDFGKSSVIVSGQIENLPVVAEIAFSDVFAMKVNESSRTITFEMVAPIRNLLSKGAAIGEDKFIQCTFKADGRNLEAALQWLRSSTSLPGQQKPDMMMARHLASPLQHLSNRRRFCVASSMAFMAMAPPQRNKYLDDIESFTQTRTEIKTKAEVSTPSSSTKKKRSRLRLSRETDGKDDDTAATAEVLGGRNLHNGNRDNNSDNNSDVDLPLSNTSVTTPVRPPSSPFSRSPLQRKSTTARRSASVSAAKATGKRAAVASPKTANKSDQFDFGMESNPKSNSKAHSKSRSASARSKSAPKSTSTSVATAVGRKRKTPPPSASSRIDAPTNAAAELKTPQKPVPGVITTTTTTVSSSSRPVKSKSVSGSGDGGDEFSRNRTSSNDRARKPTASRTLQLDLDSDTVMAGDGDINNKNDNKRQNQGLTGAWLAPSVKKPNAKTAISDPKPLLNQSKAQHRDQDEDPVRDRDRDRDDLPAPALCRESSWLRPLGSCSYPARNDQNNDDNNDNENVAGPNLRQPLFHDEDPADADMLEMTEHLAQSPPSPLVVSKRRKLAETHDLDGFVSDTKTRHLNLDKNDDAEQDSKIVRNSTTAITLTSRAGARGYNDWQAKKPHPDVGVTSSSPDSASASLDPESDAQIQLLQLQLARLKKKQAQGIRQEFERTTAVHSSNFEQTVAVSTAQFSRKMTERRAQSESELAAIHQEIKAWNKAVNDSSSKLQRRIAALNRTYNQLNKKFRTLLDPSSERVFQEAQQTAFLSLFKGTQAVMDDLEKSFAQMS